MGSGSGVLLKAIRDIDPNLDICGVDLNEYSAELCREAGFDVFHGTLHDVISSDEKYDCILFSSVLHEISSYDVTRPYSLEPIREALADARIGLNPGGRILIRDGVRCPEKKMVRIILRNIEDTVMISRFAEEYHAAPVTYRICEDGSIEMDAGTAKEFLYTYTWGPDSWPREVKEKFGIASTEEWRSLILDAGFRITMQMTASEEYLKYLSQKIILTGEIEELFEQATVLIIAEKTD